MNVTVLLSGSGTNFQAILNTIQNGSLAGVTVSKVIADRECEGINRAINHQIDYAIVSRKSKQFAQALSQAIPNETDWLVLAGFLSILPESIITQFPNRIINIHPSLLPSYGGKGMYGKRVHQAVIAAMESQSGCTVHLVDAGVDTGQILFQRKVKVFASDTAEELQQRILKQEHELFPLAIQYLNLLDQAKLLDAILKPGTRYCDQFLDQGITSFYQACHFVKNLPYHRNSKRRAACVLQEMRGVCSTKHALLKALADELNLSVELCLGVYGMNAHNTPRVASVLEKHQLDNLPEAHTYLRVNGYILDFTTSESFTADFESDLLKEVKITPQQIGQWKIDFHKRFLQDYLAQHALPYEADELWTIREACMKSILEK